MMTRGAARQGGMPLYKFVGNRILTRLQNGLLRTQSVGVPLRVPRVLRRLGAGRFRSSSTPTCSTSTPRSSFSSSRRVRIVEVPIPTYYGDEICRVNGMRYAKDVSRRP